jgi:hypothetical protein
LGLASSQAQTTATATAPAAKPVEKSWADQVKNPTSWWSWGMDIRIRNEYINNGITLAASKGDNAVVGKKVHEQDYLRFRGRLWTAFNLVPEQDLKLNARLAAEPREFLTGAGFTPLAGHKGFDGTEGVVDNLNVSWKNILKQPLTFTVGRQDIKLGDGWLVGDGTPLDGSWTYFMDSARAIMEFKEAHTAIEAIGIIQDKRDNGWLPVINAGQERLLTEQNEKGAILNVVNTSIKEMNVTGFFIYKHDDADFNARSFAAGGKVRAPDNADIYTFGLRFTGECGDHFKYWVEGAYQLGEKQDKVIINDDFAADTSVNGQFRDIKAYGVNTKFTWMFKDKLNNQIALAGEFLSGDDPSTKQDEMFDVLWGRWPHWSELGLYSFAKETRIGQEANLGRVGPVWTFNPTKKAEMSLGYYALFSPESVATRGSSTLFGNVRTGDKFEDHFRGHFATAVLKYQFNKYLSGHLWSEFLFPGEYYKSTGSAEWNRMMTFLRAELTFSF